MYLNLAYINKNMFNQQYIYIYIYTYIYTLYINVFVFSARNKVAAESLHSPLDSDCQIVPVRWTVFQACIKGFALPMIPMMLENEIFDQIILP